MSRTQGLLRRVRIRLAAVAAVEDLQVGAAVGAGVALAGLAAARLLPADAAPWLTPALSLGAGAAAAAAIPLAGLLVRRQDDREVAARADGGLGLRERMSTALWCARSADAGPLAGLVVADADAAAAAVAGRDLTRAFRPRLLRRPLAVAAALAVAAVAVSAWQPAADAAESPAAKAARLADADRIAQVARRLEQEAKRVQDEATTRKEMDLARVAQQIRDAASVMRRDPPPVAEAVSKLNELSKDAKAAAKQRAGLRAPTGTPEAQREDKALSQLLESLSKAGLETLKDDLDRALDNSRSGGSEADRPSAQSLRELADRVDQLRKALQTACENGAGEMEKSIRKIGNEDLLEKISEQLRKLAQRADRRDYQDLESEDSGESPRLDELTREELEQLLKDLEEMAGMEDLSGLTGEGSREGAGGRRMRLPRPGGAGGT